MTNSSYVITESGGRQNMYPIEPSTYHGSSYLGHAREAELANARWAMVGFVAAIGTYALTGQILPGIF